MSMLRQLFLKPLSARAMRGDPQDGAGPSTPGFDLGGAGCGDTGARACVPNKPAHCLTTACAIVACMYIL